MLTKQNLPLEFKETLKRLQENGFPEACIAGGALRDLDNGREVKDVDIFVHYRGPETFATLQGAMGHVGATLMSEESVAYVGSMADVQEIYDFRSQDEHGFDVVGAGPPYQIIAVRQGMAFDEIIGRIDLGLCQIGFDGKHLVKFPAYFTDQDDHTMTITRCDDMAQMGRTLARANRLRAKYRGWALVIPPRYQGFVMTDADLGASEGRNAA